MAIDDQNIEDSISETSWNNATGGSDFSASIDQATSNSLNGLQSKVPAGQITAEDMVSYVPDDLSPEQKNQLAQEDYYYKNPVAGPLSVEQYYPGISDPIAKGNYSGSIIGSTTLFAPGGAYMPYGVVAAREKAIQDAALKRAQQLSGPMKGDDYKSPVTKHSSVQKHLDSLYYSGLQQWTGNAKKKYGNNWPSFLKNDVGFQKWNRSMNTLKDQEDYMVDRFATLQKQIDSGDFVATPELKKSMDDFMTGVQGLSQGPGNVGGYDLSESILKFNTEYEVNKVLSAAAKDIKYKVTETYGINPNDPNYDAIVSEKLKSVDDATLRDVAKRTKKQLYFDSKYITEEKIYNGLKNFFPGEKEVQVQTVGKRDPDGGDEVFTDAQLSNEPSLETVDYQMKGGGSQEEQVAGYYGVTFSKPVKTVLPTGTRIQYPRAKEGGTISQTKTKGAQDAVISGAKVYEVIHNPGKWDDGRVVTAQRKLRDSNVKTRHEVLSFGYFIEKQQQTDEEGELLTDANGVPITKDVQVPFYVPAKDIGNAVSKRDAKGKYKSGLPLSTMEEKAKELDSGKKPYQVKVDMTSGGSGKAVIFENRGEATEAHVPVKKKRIFVKIDEKTGKPIYKDI